MRTTVAVQESERTNDNGRREGAKITWDAYGSIAQDAAEAARRDGSEMLRFVFQRIPLSFTFDASQTADTCSSEALNSYPEKKLHVSSSLYARAHDVATSVQP